MKRYRPEQIVEKLRRAGGIVAAAGYLEGESAVRC